MHFPGKAGYRIVFISLRFYPKLGQHIVRHSFVLSSSRTGIVSTGCKTHMRFYVIRVVSELKQFLAGYNAWQVRMHQWISWNWHSKTTWTTVDPWGHLPWCLLHWIRSWKQPSWICYCKIRLYGTLIWNLQIYEIDTLGIPRRALAKPNYQTLFCQSFEISLPSNVWTFDHVKNIGWETDFNEPCF